MGNKKKREKDPIPNSEQKPVMAIDKKKLSVFFAAVGIIFLILGSTIIIKSSKEVDITFYTMEGCSHCTLAKEEIYKAYQEGYKLKVNEISLDTEEKYEDFMAQGFYGTPVIIIPEANATLIGSNEAKQIHSILKELRPNVEK